MTELPQPMRHRFEALVAPINQALRAHGRPPVGPSVLERSLPEGWLAPAGSTSANGTCRLLPAANGWVALNLARPEDEELLPALFGTPQVGSAWDFAERGCASMTTQALVERATLLGLPLAALGEAAGAAASTTHRIGRPAVVGPRRLAVVDLSSLWAGPLCGSLLARMGCDVVKLESRARPDAARLSTPQFYAELNGAKSRRVVDFASGGGRQSLRNMLQAADIVIEASRPRALEQLEINAAALVRSRPGKIWVSLTAHGREGSAGLRVGFGDDAAVAGGLVAYHKGQPRFVGDAIADPLGGLAAARAVLAAMAEGGGVLIEARLAGAAAEVAGGAQRAVA